MAAAASASGRARPEPTFQSVFIVTRDGTLSFNAWLSETTRPAASADEKINGASTMHAVYNLAAGAGPSKAGGLREVRTSAVTLFTYRTPTGMLFAATATPSSPASSTTAVALFKRLHRIYADMVLKDPFVNPKQPLRSKAFADAVEACARAA